MNFVDRVKSWFLEGNLWNLEKKMLDGTARDQDVETYERMANYASEGKW